MAAATAARKIEEFRQVWSPTQEKVDRAVKTAVEIAHPSRVFVFGSWARGEAGIDSDLDLAVLLPEERSHEIAALRRMLSQALQKIPMSIDLIMVSEDYFAQFSSSINSLYYKIAHEGRQVHEQPH
jgi:predicted nucleotidyltransferase